MCVTGASCARRWIVGCIMRVTRSWESWGLWLHLQQQVWACCSVGGGA